jgi:hypothetical protein
MRDGRGGMEEMKISQLILKTRNQMKVLNKDRNMKI